MKSIFLLALAVCFVSGQACVEKNGAWQINALCVDPDFTNVTVSAETNETAPVAHRHVSGIIGGVEFNIHLPMPAAWRRRIFQTTYPAQSAVVTADQIAFGVASGAGIVQATGRIGYRAEAALAKYAKTVAAKFYGSNATVVVVLCGGSGGSYPVTGAMENTNGVWDGYVPYIVGSPVAIPNTWFIRSFARFVLGDKVAAVADAVRPGGSGDPYAGLNALETAALNEAASLGLPFGGWSGLEYVIGGTTNNIGETSDLFGFGANIRDVDPTYGSDFWSMPGYVGAEASPLGEYFRKARTQANTTVASVQRNGGGDVTFVTLSGLPAIPYPWIPFDSFVRDASGALVLLRGTLNPSTGNLTIGSGNTAATLALLASGTKVVVDNSWALAIMLYPRTQTPTATDFYPYNQYRHANGTAKYPVRDLKYGELIAGATSGGAAYSGNVTGKVIIVESLLDVDAPPFAGDWYAKRVKQALGSAAYDANVRLWYFENSDHVGFNLTRVVSYDGALQQAFRDVAAWVQDSVAPPSSSIYAVSNLTQVSVSPDARVRGGIQPSVQLTVAGKDSIAVSVGQSVSFVVAAQVPSDGSVISSVSWDLVGSGTYSAASFERVGKDAKANATYTYRAAGIYFAAVRVASDREGDADDKFAQVLNLDRVRIVVTAATDGAATTTTPATTTSATDSAINATATSPQSASTTSIGSTDSSGATFTFVSATTLLLFTLYIF